MPAEVTESIAQARRQFGLGAPRIRLWLRRVHQVQLAVATIQRTVAELGFPPIRRTRKRRPRRLKLFERELPGDCVQVDVKLVKVGGQRMFQYTALDDCTRLRVLRLYRRLNYWSSLDFLGEIRRAFPFPIRKLQSDRGAELPLAFALSVREAGIKYRYIQPRRPEQNGKVEGSHRIDDEEFWSGVRGGSAPAPGRLGRQRATACSEWNWLSSASLNPAMPVNPSRRSRRSTAPIMAGVIMAS